VTTFKSRILQENIKIEMDRERNCLDGRWIDSAQGRDQHVDLILAVFKLRDPVLEYLVN
jgi:hypothetical protein